MNGARGRSTTAVTCLAAVVLTGCTSAPRAAPTTPSVRVETRSTPVRTVPGTVYVHIGLYGGPPRRDGRMALSDSPVVGEIVSASNPSGRVWQAPTDRRGTARFTLAPGAYTVSSSYCGAPRRVHVRAAAVVRVHIVCAVP